MKSTIVKLNLDELDSALTVYRMTHSRQPDYLIMHPATLKLLKIECERLVIMPYSDETQIMKYHGISIATSNAVEIGSVDIK